MHSAFSHSIGAGLTYPICYGNVITEQHSPMTTGALNPNENSEKLFNGVSLNKEVLLHRV